MSRRKKGKRGAKGEFLVRLKLREVPRSTTHSFDQLLNLDRVLRIERTGQTAFPASLSELPSLRSSSCQHQISPLPSSVLTPTHVCLVLLTRIDSEEVSGTERATAEVVGENEGPTVIEDSGV